MKMLVCVPPYKVTGCRQSHKRIVAVFKGAIWDCAEYDNLCIIWRCTQEAEEFCLENREVANNGAWVQILPPPPLTLRIGVLGIASKYMRIYRSVTQMARVPIWYVGCRWFESNHSYQSFKSIYLFGFDFRACPCGRALVRKQRNIASFWNLLRGVINPLR